jgi:hypothetical protein
MAQDPLNPLSVGPQTPVRAEKSGEYSTFDIGRNQDVRETLQLLSHNLAIKKKYLFDADNCYHGDSSHQSFNSEQFRSTFIHLRHFSDNWLKMIVDAYVGRLVIQGFNVGSESGNEAAWSLFRANNLDKFAQLAHRETMKFGECYLLVDPTVTVPDKSGSDKTFPRITVETPYQVIGWQDPNNRAQNVCALKYWQAADGYVYANLFTASKVLKFQSPESYFRWNEAGYPTHIPIPQSIPWAQYDEFDHDLGICPVFTIENQPTLTRGGVSDLEELIPLQKSIDVEIKNMLLSSEFNAWPQRYALNVAVDRNVDGTPVLNTQMEAAYSRFWGFPPPEKKGAPEVKVGAFPVGDVAQYTVAIEELIENMAHISSIPAYRLMGKLANMSASAIIAAEAGFIDVCRIKMTDYSLGWESAMSLALDISGVPVKNVETLWKDPSAVSGPNLAAALVALESIGVPQKILFKMLGAGPQEVDEWMKIAKEQAKENSELGIKAEANKTKLLENSLNELTSNNQPNANSSGDEEQSTNGESLTGNGSGSPAHSSE